MSRVKGVSAPTIAGASKVVELINWGEVPTRLEGRAQTSGLLLHKGGDGQSECGIWVCTPGIWECEVTRDEFCHFLAGHCTYVHESGETLDIEADTSAFFPRAWRGVCTVHETVRKVYMIR